MHRNNRNNWFILIPIFFLVLSIKTFAQSPKSPYPIIFVHGLASEDLTWSQTIDTLEQIWGTHGENHVFHAVLNAYGDMTNIAGSDNILGNADDDVQIEFNNETNDLDSGNIFAINFKNFWDKTDRTIDKYSTWDPSLFGGESESHQSSIYKQGYALGKMIEKVLIATGAEKVVLVGHSMGGLASREYLQRKENGIPRWWVDKMDLVNGHKVAKLITIGTPHSGSNSADQIINIILINLQSEAVRDLRYSYNNIFNGRYFYGGSELSILSGDWFHNFDVNCDGDNSDVIVGINNSPTDFIANQSMPLPENIEYTWITSNSNIANGDRVVDLKRQWLHTTVNGSEKSYPLYISDSLLTDQFHTDEPSDYYSIIRGLDEPDQPGLAYELNLDETITGLVTIQTNSGTTDNDYYIIKENMSSTDLTKITLDGAGSGVQQLEVYGPDNNFITGGIGTFPYELLVPSTSTDLILRVIGAATPTTWKHPYTLTATKVAPQYTADFEYDTNTGPSPLTVHFVDNSSPQDLISQWSWDFDNNGIIDATEQNPTYTYSSPGTYSVKLTVSDGVNSATVIKDDIMTVNTPVIGHDLALLNLDLDKESLSPGEDLDFKFDLRNYGLFTENTYILRYQLIDSNGLVVEEDYENGISIAPQEILPKFDRTLSLSNNLNDGFYNFKVTIQLGNDNAVGNNILTRSIYIGDENPYTTYTLINNGDILIKNNPVGLGTYTVTLIFHDSNTARVTVQKGGFSQTRIIDFNQLAFFDASRFFLIYKGYVSGTEGFFVYGEPTTEVSFSPQSLTIEAGKTSTVNVNSNEDDNTPSIDLFNEGGLDIAEVHNWTFNPYIVSTPYRNFFLNITPTADAQRKTYDFWFKHTANGSFIQQMQVKVINPLPDFTYSYNKDALILADGIDDQLQLDLDPLNGFSENVNLSITDLPNGVSANFSSNNITPPNTVTVGFTYDNSATNYGFHEAQINMVSNTRTYSINVSINIFDTSERYLLIDSLSYADIDGKKDSLKIYYTTQFTHTTTGQTVDWQYSLDGGQTYTNIAEADIFNNQAKPSGSDYIIWKIPGSIIQYTNGAIFKMRHKAGSNLLQFLRSQGFDNQDFAAIMIYNDIIYVLDQTQSRVNRFVYTNNNLVYQGSSTISGVPNGRGSEFVKTNDRIYLLDTSDEFVYMYNLNWGYLGRKQINSAWYTLFNLNGSLYFYDNDLVGLVEVNSDLNPTGFIQSIPIRKTYDHSFVDGSTLWMIDSRTAYKFSHNFDSYETFSVDQNFDIDAVVYNDLVFTTSGNDNIYIYNFKEPYSLYTNSEEFIINNSYSPVVDEINDFILEEDQNYFNAIDLIDKISDQDTPFSELALSLSNSSANAYAEFNVDSTFVNILIFKDWYGSTKFDLIVDDGNNIVTRTVNIIVDPINDAPVLSSFPDITFPEDYNYVINLNDFVTDVDDDVNDLIWDASLIDSALMNNIKRGISEGKLAIRDIVLEKTGSIEDDEKSSDVRIFDAFMNSVQDSLIFEINNSNKTLTISSVTNFYGLEIPIQISVTDPHNETDLDTFQVNILPTNDPPSVFSRIIPEDDSTIASDTLMFTWSTSHDVENDPVTYSIFFRASNVDTVLTTSDTVLTIIRANFSLMSKDTIQWAVIAADTINSTEASNGVGMFYLDSLGSDITLPVSLSSFSASAGDGFVYLKWITESELYNEAFILQRSEDNEEFATITEIPGAINSNERIVYDYKDKYVRNGQTYYYRIGDRDLNGLITFHNSISAIPNSNGEIIHKEEDAITKRFYLHQNYPNPFNPSTTIKFEIPSNGIEIRNLNVSIFNLLGQRVRALIKDKLDGGIYEITWDGRDEYGNGLPSGIYFVYFKSNYYSQTRKMLMLK